MYNIILKVTEINTINNNVYCKDNLGISYSFYNNNFDLKINDYIAVNSRVIDFSSLKAEYEHVYIKYANVIKLKIVNNKLVTLDNKHVTGCIYNQVKKYINRQAKQKIQDDINNLEYLLKMSYANYLKDLNSFCKNFKENTKTEQCYIDDKKSYKIRLEQKQMQLKMLDKLQKTA